MISLKSSTQMELSFSLRQLADWRKLSGEEQHEILEPLSLLLLYNLEEEINQTKSEQEDQLCQVK